MKWKWKLRTWWRLLAVGSRVDGHPCTEEPAKVHADNGKHYNSFETSLVVIGTSQSQKRKTNQSGCRAHRAIGLWDKLPVTSDDLDGIIPEMWPRDYWCFEKNLWKFLIHFGRLKTAGDSNSHWYCLISI